MLKFGRTVRNLGPPIKSLKLMLTYIILFFKAVKM